MGRFSCFEAVRATTERVLYCNVGVCKRLTVTMVVGLMEGGSFGIGCNTGGHVATLLWVIVYKPSIELTPERHTNSRFSKILVCFSSFEGEKWLHGDNQGDFTALIHPLLVLQSVLTFAIGALVREIEVAWGNDICHFPTWGTDMTLGISEDFSWRLRAPSSKSGLWAMVPMGF